VGILGKALQHLCGGLKDQRQQQYTSVAHYQRVELMCQGKDQMKVAARQHLGHAGIEPFFLGNTLAFGTVPVAARVVGRSPKATTTTSCSGDIRWD